MLMLKIITMLKVWNEFEMKAVGDFHNLYLKRDILLFADIFEEFRNECLECYGLDLSYYFNNPGLSLDDKFKIVHVELDLTSAIDMHQFIKKSY